MRPSAVVTSNLVPTTEIELTVCPVPASAGSIAAMLEIAAAIAASA
jgi:hypothetical protein